MIQVAQIVQAQALADFVNDASLATAPATWANAILAAAQVAVEQWLTGRDGSLTSGASKTETIYLRLASTIVPLRYGPASAVASVTIDDVDYTDSFELRPYSLRVLPSSDLDLLTSAGVLPGQKVVVTYTQGWSNVADVPNPISQAILFTAAPLLNRQSGDVVRESIGQASVTYLNRPLEVPAIAKSLASSYRDPGMVGV